MTKVELDNHKEHSKPFTLPTHDHGGENKNMGRSGGRKDS